MFASTRACSLIGVEGQPVLVEAHGERGLPRFTIIGLRESEAREARERIRCALLAIGVELPLQRITVSLSPADLPKSGAAFDLSIALAVLAAMKVVPAERVEKICAHAEVGLDGTIRPTRGSLAAALLVSKLGLKGLVVASDSNGLAAASGVPVIASDHLGGLVVQLATPKLALSSGKQIRRTGPPSTSYGDMRDVKGQAFAVEAAVTAAAGGHNLILHGPPGCGKTMISSRLPGLLPPPDEIESLEVATIHDAAGLENDFEFGARPFRAPHHSVTTQALIGGGSSKPVVGEMTLAHNGVLFLDELPEFRPNAIDALRQPLESGVVVVRRSNWFARYPARVQLVAAMNLCRCGRRGASAGKVCECTELDVQRYQNRVSGAIFERFAVSVPMDPPAQGLSNLPDGIPSAVLAERVVQARDMQHKRWGKNVLNSMVNGRRISRVPIAPNAVDLLNGAISAFGISARRQTSILALALTIGDLECSTARVESKHLAKAISLSGNLATIADVTGGES